MSLTFKKASRNDLRKVSVYIEDNTPTSPNYFRMSNVPEVLTKGKNLLRISAHPTNLVDNTPILIDVRDSNGDPIYYEIPDYIEEDKSRVISIWIYHDKDDDNTPNGIATITIIGTSKYGSNGEAIPIEFSGKPNVKWQTTVNVDRNRKSDTAIIFDSLSLPTLIVSESLGLYESVPTTGAELTETTVTSTEARYIYKGTTPIIQLHDTTFNNEMIGGSISFERLLATQLPTATKPNPLTSDYVTTITEIVDSKTAIVESPFTTKFLNLADEIHTYTSAQSIQTIINYVSTGSNVTTNSQQSFVNLTLSSVEPVSGVVDKIKILMKTSGLNSDYELLSTNEVPFSSSISLKLAVPTEHETIPRSFKIQYLNAAGDISRTETTSDPYVFQGVESKVLYGEFQMSGSMYVSGSIILTDGTNLNTVKGKSTNYRRSRELNLPYADEDTQTVLIPEYNDIVYGGATSLIYVDKYECLFASVNSITGSFIRFNDPNDLTDYTYTNVQSAAIGYGWPQQIMYSSYKDRVYMTLSDFAWAKNRLRVIEIHPSSSAFSMVIDQDLTANGYQLTGATTFTIIDNHIYTVNGYYNAQLMKFNLDTYALVSTLTLPEANNSFYGMETDGKSIYLSTTWNSTNHSVVRVNPVSMAIEQQATYDLGTYSGATSGIADDIVIWGDHLYLPLHKLDTNYILKVKKTNLTEHVYLDLNLPNPSGSMNIFASDNLLHIGGSDYFSTFNPASGDVVSYDIPEFQTPDFYEMATDGTRYFVNAMSGSSPFPANNNAYISRFTHLTHIKESYKVNTTTGLLDTRQTIANLVGADLVVKSITAEQYVISSSVTYVTTSFSSGSTIFGDDILDTHQFTGSLYVSGSINVNGDISASTFNGLPITSTDTGNIGLGISTIDSITTGDYNIGIGATVLTANTTGYYNIALGFDVLANNISGSGNIGIGTKALAANTNNYNTSVGQESLRENTAAGNNAFGYRALTVNATGTGNSAFGYESLKANTTGVSNTAVGNESLLTNISGHKNTAVGDNALVNTTAGYNTAVGWAAGDNITSGASNIIIGSGMDALSATNDDQLNIGNWIYGHEGNIGIGTTLSTHKLRVAGDISASSYYGDGSNLTGVSGGGGLSVANSANNRIITSVDSSNANAEASLTFDGSSLIVTGSTTLHRSGSVGDASVLSIEGGLGNLFSITDELSGSLFSVNDISGLPVLEVFSDNTMKMGPFGAEAIFVNNAASGSSVGIGHVPLYRFDVSGSARITDTLTVNTTVYTSQTDLKEQISTIDKSKAATIVFKEYQFKTGGDGRKRYGVLAEDIEDDYPELVYTGYDGVKGVNYIDLLVKRVAELEKELADVSGSVGNHLSNVTSMGINSKSKKLEITIEGTTYTFTPDR